MTRMPEEEADYWDEYYTKNPPKIDPSKKCVRNIEGVCVKMYHGVGPEKITLKKVEKPA